jgi:hypothetical protein
VLLAFQDTVLPVRQGVRNLPADVNRPRGARPANEDKGLGTHTAGKLGRHPPAGAVAHDLRIVGERGRYRLQLRPPGVWRIPPTISRGIPTVVKNSSTASPRRPSDNNASRSNEYSREIRCSSSPSVL